MATKKKLILKQLNFGSRPSQQHWRTTRPLWKATNLHVTLLNNQLEDVLHRIDVLGSNTKRLPFTPWLMTYFRSSWFQWSSFSQRFHLQDLATKILLLINIYIKILSHCLPNFVLLIHDHNALPPENLDNLINTFQLTQSYFSRPLTSRSLECSWATLSFTFQIVAKFCALVFVCLMQLHAMEEKRSMTFQLEMKVDFICIKGLIHSQFIIGICSEGIYHNRLTRFIYIHESIY